MPKRQVVESRYDFRGGRNVYLSPDLLSANELVASSNTRIDTDGPIVKRTGSRRMHATALAASTAIKGITQWDGPSGRQIVAICNGDLFYRNESAGEFAAFTQVDPGATDAFSTTAAAVFAPLRGAIENAPLQLYIASGGKFYQWTGTTLSRLDGAGSIVGHFCPDASIIESYHIRIFANSILRPQHTIWSKLADATNFRGGLAADGGAALVGSLRAESISAMGTLGRSLLIFSQDSTNRVSGYSAQDIQIDQDTEALSPDVGCVGPLALHRVENLIAFMSAKGLYLASEGGIAPVGLKVQPDFDAMDRTKLSAIVVGHHHGREEIWVAHVGASDSGLNKSVLVYNNRHRAWYGPFVYTFGVQCLTHYEDANGDEFLIAGCSDGFVRHLDIGGLDDVLSDNSGGSAYTMDATLAPMFFDHPGEQKALRWAFVQAEVPASAALTIEVSFDGAAYTVFNIASTAGVLKNSRIALSGKGRRLSVRIRDGGSAIPAIHGVIVQGSALDRIN